MKRVIIPAITPLYEKGVKAMAPFRVILCLIFLPLEAFAWCSEPSAPSAPSSFDEPDVPYCLTDYKYSGKHTCDSWEVDSYINDYDDYIRKLNTYVSEAFSFADDAQSFAKCKAEEAKDEAGL